MPQPTAPYRKSIGLIGGLGPLAGATVYQRLVEAAGADSDEEHPEVVLLSDPAVPSRQAHLRGRGPTPVPRLCQMARRLENAGCGVLLITSVTTHAYADDIRSCVRVPVIDAPAAVAEALRSAGVAHPALAVTTPARTHGLLDRALSAAGIQPRYPDDVVQETIQNIVMAVKAGGDLTCLGQELDAALTGGWTTEADVAVIGCTDMALLVPYLQHPVHDVAAIMAGAALAEACR
ncbi:MULTISPECIES: aspartate/glutamate racemase family protein [unclassified Streptomyces]|uniref:aspartate/glutamate racemase family protein n=1 Tax=unclassified Streptomyces TaxID=2593676 RepID=UPI0036EFE86B